MFGANLQHHREALGLSQSDLSMQTGLPIEALQNLEAGVTAPTPDVVDQLARALGVPADELADGTVATGGSAADVAYEKP
jgi:transcriptional regulator with XRE-family HTH domain